ncbi:ankyrin repeat protein [Fontibacillus phaseoli]|uniref:Ankyrin repeat protein n=1 Tax=Fontibacillus phaseoli TaxID=1416533 RepID=A0A369AZF7_9BACL|nr:hypothetical protein [Fontibacillus phaseoli]RCX13566.1 ankyrin repeat protein [Fontibacillus phaseoli]
MRTLFISVLVTFTLIVTSCSGAPGKEEGLQSEDLSAISTGITAADWEEQVGYDRLRVFVGSILKDWRGQGIEVETFFENDEVEAEFWTEMVLIYFSEEEGRDSTLLDAMKWIRDNQDLIKEQGVAASAEFSASLDPAQSLPSDKQPQNNGNTQLVEAINNGDTMAVEQLLSQGADPNTVDEYGNSLLTLAVNRGDYASDVPDPELMKAGRKKALELVKLLLVGGADPNAQTSGQPVLISAGIFLPEACVPLLEAGAEANAKDGLGNTVLYFLLDDEEVFAALLKYGANPDLENNDGKTVYDEVRKQNATAIAKLLNMPLKEQTVTPASPHVASIFEKVHEGINQNEAITLFGPNPVKGEDEMDGSEIWEYIDAIIRIQTSCRGVWDHRCGRDTIGKREHAVVHSLE